MSIKTSVRKITPAMAVKWLENTSFQRPVKQSHVDWLAQQMTEGAWRLNGESIVLTGDAVLDGQHRLWACIEANLPFDSLVVEGVESDAFSTIDTGRVRNTSDITAIVIGDKSIPVATLKAASTAAGLVLAFDTGGRFNSATYRETTNTKIADFVNRHKVIVDVAAKVRSLYTRNVGATASHLVAVTFLVCRGFPEVIESFMEPVMSGAGLVRDSAAFAFRGKCIADPTPPDFRTQFNRLAVLIKAWNAHVQGEPVRHLRYHAGVEAFPTLIMAPGQKVQNRKKA